MKKLLCVALFSIAIMAKATEKKEIVPNNSRELKIEKINLSTASETESIDVAVEPLKVLADCGAQGDAYYHRLMDAGADHRDARSARRDFVRDCRGGTWAWLGVCIGFIGRCDD
jgi:hypothetical protein